MTDFGKDPCGNKKTWPNYPLFEGQPQNVGPSLEESIPNKKDVAAITIVEKQEIEVMECGFSGAFSWISRKNWLKNGYTGNWFWGLETDGWFYIRLFGFELSVASGS